MTESKLYRSLGAPSRDLQEYESRIPYVASLLACDSVRIRAKALWQLGEMGMRYPPSVQDSVPAIASFLQSAEPLLRERAVIALGRIGRGSFSVIEPYWESLFRFADDPQATVRLAFIWSSENIATNTPDVYADYMPVFARLLHDGDDRVRMEAPEIFRVLGKRRPAFVAPYIALLRSISETDAHPVVRAHCAGAIRAADLQKEDA